MVVPDFEFHKGYKMAIGQCNCWSELILYFPNFMSRLLLCICLIIWNLKNLPKFWLSCVHQR